MNISVRLDRPRPIVLGFQDYGKLLRLGGQVESPRHALHVRRWRALNGLLEAFRIRDRQTWKHARRVHDMAVQLAETLGLSSTDIRQLQMTALLHDIGKMAVSDAILNKEASLTHSEFDSVRQHPILGERLVAPLMPMPLILSGIRHHHERLDGRGYPDGLRQGEISLFARLVSVVDVYDALTHRRPYRQHPLSPFAACEVLTAQAGSHLDPELVEPFCRMIRSSAETIVDIR